MTDPFKGLQVTFEQNIREDDAQAIIDAISLIKGVVSVMPVKGKVEDSIIEARIKHKLTQLILEVLE